MKFSLIRQNIAGAILLLSCLGFANPCLADTHSEWLEWKEKGRREQASLNYNMAEDYYLRSILEASKIGPNSIELIESKLRLTACLVCQKKFSQAEPYYLNLQAVIENLRKKKALNAEVLVWLEQLAEAYESTAMPSASSLPGRKTYGLEHALALRDLISGDEHPEISYTLKKLGKLYLEQGNYVAAEKTVARLVRVDLKYRGVDNFIVADDLCGLGVIVSDLNEWDKAESYFRQAMAILMKSDPTHRTIMLFNVRTMIARTMLKKEEVALSEKEATAALADFAKGDGKGKNEWMSVYGRHIIAWCRQKQKRYDEALKIYSNNIALVESVVGKDDWRMIIHWKRIQRVYKEMNATSKFNEVEETINRIEAASHSRKSKTNPPMNAKEME